MKNDTMHIIMFVKTLHFGFKGGIQTHVWKLATELNQRGHRITIITAKKPSWGFDETERDGIRLIKVPFIPGKLGFRHLYKVDEYSYNYFALQAVKKLLDGGEEIDLLHAHGRSGFWAVRQHHELGIPAVTTLHAFTSEEAGDFIDNPNLSRRQRAELRHFNTYGNVIEKNVVRQADRVIAVSEKLKRGVSERYGVDLGRIDVVPNGLNSDIYVPEPEKKVPGRVVCVGRLAPVKGIEYLINAVDMIRDLEPLSVHIVGSGPQQPYYQSLVKSKNLESMITFVGEKQENEVIDEYQQASLFALPSLNEGQGIVYMEAMSCGLPVVSFNIDAVNEMIHDGVEGFMVEKLNTRAFADAMRNILTEPHRAEQMGKAGRRRVQANYQWRDIAAKTVDVYRNTIPQESI